jgi:PAS domain S-box-containing protein
MISNFYVFLKKTGMDYKTIFNHISEGLLIFDDQGRIIDANPSALNLYGYTYEEMITLTGENIVSDDHYFKFLDFLKTLETENTFSCFSVDKRKDGTFISVVVNGYRVTYKNRSHLLAVIRDVTDIRELENQLKNRNEELVSQNEEYYSVNEELRKTINELNEAKISLQKNQQEKKLILDSINEWIALMDLDFNYIWVNKSFTGYTSCSVSEACHRKCYDIWFKRDSFCEHCPVKRTIETGLHQQARHTDAMGRTWLIMTSPVRNENNELTGVIETGSDITHHVESETKIKDAEENYRLIADNSSDVIFLLDMNLNYRYISPSVERLRGFTVPEVINETIEKSLTPDSYKQVITAIKEELAKESDPLADPDRNRVLELEMYKKDRTVVWTEVSAKLLRNEKREVTGIVGATRDISERKRTEQVLFESQERFRVAQEMSSDGFTILHPLRNENGEVVDFTWVYENQAIAHINGTDPKEIKGKRLLELFPGHKGTSLFETYIQVANSGNTQIIEDIYVGEIVSIPTWLRMVIVSMGEDIAILAQNITTRKQTEEKIRESEEKFRLLVSQMNQALAVHEIILDDKGIPCDYRFLYVNNSFEKLTGLKASEITGKTLFEVIPDSEMKWVEMYGKVAITGKPLQFESHSVALKRYYEITAYRNKPGQFVTIFSDITERKLFLTQLKEKQEEIETQNEEYKKLNEELTLAKEKAEQNEEKFYNLSKKQEALLDAVPEILMEVDTNKIYTYANDGGRHFFGDDVIGKEALYYFEGEQETYDIVSPIFEGREEVIYVESYQRRKDGERRLLAWWSKVLKDKEGNVTGCISTARDITDSRKSEELIKTSAEKWQTTFNAMTDIISVISKENEFLEINKAGCDAMGLQHHEIIGKKCFELVHKMNHPHPDCPCIPCLSSKKMESGEIFENGRYYQVTAWPIFNERGEVYAFSHAIKDITDQKKKEEEIRIAREKAEESDRLKTAFLANMSHEIRTPMNGIIGFAELLKNKEINEETRFKYSNIIVQSSNRLLTIINDILDISKIETGQMVINYAPCNIIELINKLAGFYKPQGDARGIECRCSVPEKPIIVNIDELRLYQILNNLLSNAFKFTSTGYIELGLDYKNNKLFFVVRDSGSGIEKKSLTRIFDRFWQAEKDFMKAGSGGSGLGLAIVKSLTELMGGRVWAESESGMGSAFFVEIPAEELLEKRVQSAQVKFEAGYIPADFTHILIADDEFLNYYYLEALFSKMNVVLYYAKNGQEAIDIFNSKPLTDLVIMDIRMPVMDGVTALKKIKEINSKIPVVAYTAYAMKGDREKYIAAGFDEFITKPLDKEQLWIALKKLGK